MNNNNRGATCRRPPTLQGPCCFCCCLCCFCSCLCWSFLLLTAAFAAASVCVPGVCGAFPVAAVCAAPAVAFTAASVDFALLLLQLLLLPLFGPPTLEPPPLQLLTFQNVKTNFKIDQTPLTSGKVNDQLSEKMPVSRADSQSKATTKVEAKARLLGPHGSAESLVSFTRWTSDFGSINQHAD